MASPPSQPRPCASIVVPVYDRADLTRQLLDALPRATAPGSYELIVVDNASSDETPALLAAEAAAGRLRAIRNEVNVGFARACNQGAAAATAPYALFLNNDTVPTEGWLDALLEAAAEPNVGAVGARLLYPDGRIQHAGMDWCDGVPDHPFRFAAADDPRVLARRDLDMVTGACLLMPRDLFEELGGFDTGYLNGSEDVDLCLRVRAAGRRVVYEPRAVVYHHESQSAGRYDHATANAIRFRERWLDRVGPDGRFGGCVWRGESGSHHSLAIVNDAVVDALAARGAHVVRTERHDVASPLAAPGVAAQWPPRFEAPSAGPFVLYQPFEFGAVPATWVEEIRSQVDEVWTPSEYAREAYVNSGVAPELVHVVPNGVDLARFAPEGPRRDLPTEKGTVFLFVGGTIYRKGIDVLLDAYGRAFGADDDVALVVKGIGGASFYRGQTAESQLDAFRARPGAPELVVLDEEVPFDELPALYRAADVLVQPYRGEGFCLPALEALACGRPLVVTAGGPTDEFASDACAWRVESRRVRVPAQSFEVELAADGYLLEPDLDALVAALRAAADPAARAAKAARAREHAERFSWEAAAERAAERLARLEGRTPIRSTPRVSVPGARRHLFVVEPDWSERGSWAPALHAYASAFGPDDDTTLVLPARDEAAAVALVSAELERAGIDLATLADIAIADPEAVPAEGLALAADAVISIDGRRAARARRTLPPDPAALRAVVNA